MLFCLHISSYFILPKTENRQEKRGMPTSLIIIYYLLLPTTADYHYKIVIRRELIVIKGRQRCKHLSYLLLGQDVDWEVTPPLLFELLLLRNCHLRVCYAMATFQYNIHDYDLRYDRNGGIKCTPVPLIAGQ